MKHIVYAAGTLYQHISPDASITFEAGTLQPVIGEEATFPGVSGTRKGIIGKVTGVAVRSIDDVTGVAWTAI